MRVVEKNVIDAIKAGTTRTCSPNTRVEVAGGRVAVKLHGHVIFESDVGGGNPSFPYKGGWMYTMTTKSRIRAIAYGLGVERPEGY
jgi:hypothetical protein